MPTVKNCKACQSPNRQFIDSELAKGTAARVIAEELAARGEKFSLSNLYTHKAKHYEEPEEETPALDAALDVLRLRVEEEMAGAPSSMVAAGWLVVLHQLHGLKNSKQTPEALIKALSLMGRIGGINNEQANLLAYMERAWPNQKPTLKAVPDDE